MLISRRILSLTLLAPFSLAASTVIGTNFSGINLNQTIAFNEGAIPSDMGMAVGPSQIVQMVNGAYSVFDKSGATLSLTSDIAFWNSAGIAGSTTVSGVSDPRVIYDPGSQRFFATQINVTNTGNQVLLGISNSSNALGGWQAVQFTGNAGFADFPMLGVDQNGVYLSIVNFTSSVGTYTGNSVFSIPKNDLILGTPTLANLSGFQNLDSNVYGFGMHPANDTGGAHGALLAISATDLFKANYADLTNTNTASATLSSSTVLTGLSDGAVGGARQPDGTNTLDGGDDRFGSTPFIVGNYLYATNTFGDNGDPAQVTHDMVHWLILDLTTKLVLAQGTISDPGFDYTYSSIAANGNGDFVIAFNRSGPAANAGNNISAYAEHCHFNGASAVCENPILLKQGLSGSYQLGPPNRWGDYSAIAVDPTNPNIFWTALGFPSAGNRWSTQITQIAVTPEPATWVLFGAGALLLLRRRAKS